MSGTRFEDVEVQVLVDATWLDGWLDTWQKRDGPGVGSFGTGPAGPEPPRLVHQDHSRQV
jgi:hypothetical protein